MPHGRDAWVLSTWTGSCRLVAVCASSMVLGCGSRVVIVPDDAGIDGTANDSGGRVMGDDGEGEGAIDDASGLGAAMPAEDSASSLFTAEQVQAASAQCGGAHGPADPFMTVGELKARLVGSWFCCPSMAPFAASMAFSNDGQFYRLLSDASGGLAHGWGVVNQGMYAPSTDPAGDAATDAGDSQSVGLELHLFFANGSQSAWITSFETSPRRMKVLAGMWEIWFVPLGP